MSAVETRKPARRANRRASARLKSVAGFLVVVATTYLGLLAVTAVIRSQGRTGRERTLQGNNAVFALGESV